MKAALLGFPQSGKTTILSAISGHDLTGKAPGSTNEEVVAVPDTRIEWLTELHSPKKVTLATIECLDLPPIAFDTEKNRNGARALFRDLRTVDMLVLVVRAFANPAVAPYRESVNAARDVEELKLELVLGDLELVTTRIERLEHSIKKNAKTKIQDQKELVVQQQLQEALENEKPVSTVLEGDPVAQTMVKSLGFMTEKPLMVLVNTDDSDINTTFDFGLGEDVPVSSLCASIEMELTELEEDDRKEFMADLGITQSAGGTFVNNCYAALGLISFLTMGPDEVRAWPIPKGISAMGAAGKIHSDILRGFIRAVTIAFDDLKELGDEQAVKAAGKIRMEGKTYIVADGDIIDFRFNV